MIGFEEIAKLYLAAHGVTHVTLRSGRYPIEQVSLIGLLPYLAWQTEFGARLLVGTIPLEAEIYIDRPSLTIRSKRPVKVMNIEVCLQGLSYAFLGCEKGNLIPIEDEITDVIKKHQGSIDIQAQINNTLINSYQQYLDGWQRVNEKDFTPSPDMGIA